MMEIKGQFVKTIYYRQDNGYVVALFHCEQEHGDDQIVITGYLGKIDQEKKYCLFGEYIDHPKYGIQFKVEHFERIIATDEEGLIKYFSSDLFSGIGKVFATSIVCTLGLQAIDKIKADEAVLDTIPKMNKKRKIAILEGLKKDVDDDIVFLSSHQLSLKNIMRLKNFYHDQLIEKLLENPYRVIREVSGIGFATIDKFALSIGVQADDLQRLIAYSEEILMHQCMKNGDSYIFLEQFHQVLQQHFSIYSIDIPQIIEGLMAQRSIVVEEDRVYPVSQYDGENFIARFLTSFPSSPLPTISSDVLDAALKDFEDQIGIQYQDKQLLAIKAFFNKDLLILTGGPGTGKTTIVRAMIQLSKSLYTQNSIQLIAPTGRAAKRLSELTNHDAKTIHSLLLWDKETGKFAKDENDPLTVEILIIDEFSMVDTYLFSKLLRATPYLKKLIIIGDSDQLPSVAMGAVLQDLIDSCCFDVIALDKIYRQKEGSDIISLAYDIKNDCCQTIPTQNDIRFIECSHHDIRNTLLYVVDRALKQYDSLVEGFMNVQVLAPKHLGLNGINSLNVALQNEFNPKEKGKRELQIGYRTYRLYDKILQLKNQPDDDVFNGDIGILVEIIYPNEDINGQKRIIVDFDGRLVEYTNETFANITHAYCMSVHKAQGSEYPIIIMPFDKEYGIMLQKRLIYTAVSRAYKNLIMIGDLSAFYQGIHTIDHYSRKTTLKERIQTQYENEL